MKPLECTVSFLGEYRNSSALSVLPAAEEAATYVLDFLEATCIITTGLGWLGNVATKLAMTRPDLQVELFLPCEADVFVTEGHARLELLDPKVMPVLGQSPKQQLLASHNSFAAEGKQYIRSTVLDKLPNLVGSVRTFKSILACGRAIGQRSDVLVLFSLGVGLPVLAEVAVANCSGTVLELML